MRPEGLNSKYHSSLSAHFFDGQHILKLFETGVFFKDNTRVKSEWEVIFSLKFPVRFRIIRQKMCSSHYNSQCNHFFCAPRWTRSCHLAQSSTDYMRTSAKENGKSSHVDGWCSVYFSDLRDFSLP